MQDIRTSRVELDTAAISLSVICAAHCLLMPLAVAIVPALTATALNDEQFHRLLLVAVLPTSLLALGLGCRKHHRIGLFGLGLVMLGHERLGEVGEKVIVLSGTAIIAYAHVRNYTLCRARVCHR